MSVITDALKRAQQEKSRRAARNSPPTSAPVLVPLRGVQPVRLDWRRILVLSGGALAAVSVIAVLVAQSRSEPSLPSVPPLTSTILREAIAADSATRARPSPTQVALARDSAPAAAAVTESGTLAMSPTAVGPGDASAAPLSVQQSAERLESAVPVVRLHSDPRVDGRLRIAVEQQASPDAGRLFNAAVQAHRAGDLAAARSLYERVLAQTPSDGDALNNLGVVLSAQREFESALELLRRAASLAPRSAGPWNNIGTVLREQGRSDEAIAAFRTALSIDPAHQGARIGLAQVYFATKEFDQAKVLLDDVLAANPQVPEAQYTLGQILELQGDREGAVRAYRSFLAAAPERLAAHAELVRRRVEALTRTQ